MLYMNIGQRSNRLERPVIMVVVNYRLSVFGFLASKELQEEMNENASLSPYDRSIGNWGLMDQRFVSRCWESSHQERNQWYSRRWICPHWAFAPAPYPRHMFYFRGRGNRTGDRQR
ncbi:hypothetical protein BGZ75_001933 [Mortierella antarctica]|nr:hypothetical protein BGZ75_001933 [Mortierella antarctica]